MFSQANGQALRYHYDPSRPSFASGYYPVMHQASGYTQQGMFYTFPYPGPALAGFHPAMAAPDRESNLDEQFDRRMTLNETSSQTEQANSTTMPAISASAGAAAEQRKEMELFKLWAKEPELLDHHKFEYWVNINSNRALFDDSHSPCFFSSLAVNSDPAALLKLIYQLSRNLQQADPTSRYEYSPPSIDRHKWPIPRRTTEATAHRHLPERHAREERQAERSTEDSSQTHRLERRERSHQARETNTTPSSSRHGEASRQLHRADSPHQSPAIHRDRGLPRTTIPSPPSDRQELEDLRERFITQQVELEALKKKATKTCTICYEADIDCVFLECLHMYCCTGCARGCVQDGRAICSICRKTAPAPGYVKVFMS